MGMDVSGKNPKSEAGAYFRANVWSWHPIWDYCTLIAPALTDKVEHAHSNDGDGLGARDAEALGKKVLKSIADGSAKRYVAERDRGLDNLPRKTCEWCHGTGHRDDEVGKQCRAHDPKFTCNGCKGKGTCESLDSWYRFTVEHLEAFGHFLTDCGGFEIF